MSIAKFRLAPWSDGQVALFVFIALWLTYGFFVGDFNTTNAVARMAIIFSILDPSALPLDTVASVAIDRTREGLPIATDLAPGLSLTALPFVALLTWAARALHFAAQPIVDGKLTPFYMLATAVASFFTGGLFAAAAAAMGYRLARHWRVSRSAALYGALSLGLASPLLGWAGVFYTHATAAGCLFIAFACIALAAERPADPRRGMLGAALVGLLLGWAAAVEPTATLAAVLVAAFGVWTLRSVEPGRAGLMVGAAVVGAIAALVPTLVYNIAIYGGVFHAGLEQPAVMPEGAAILSWPSPSRLLGLLFGGFRGLLWVAPLIVIVPLGYWVSFRRIARPAWWLLLGLPVAQLVLIAGYAYAWGGWSTGPRFLVPALPFLWLPLAFLWQRAGEGPRLTLAGCSLVGACAALTAASVSMASPTPYPNPMLSYVLPLFAGGFIRNALTLAGGRGFPTLVALPVLWLAAAAVVAALAGRAVAVVDAAPRPQAAPPSRKQAAARNR